MAEAAEHHPGAGHATEQAGGKEDPLHHIKDEVLLGYGVDGRCWKKPYGHGHPRTNAEGVVYLAREVGPFKLEFTKHMLGVTVVATLLAVVIISAARRIIANMQADQAPRGPLANAVEALLVFVRDELVEPVGGHHLIHYTPLFVTYFFFILFLNLAGMIPEFGSATGNIAVTGALGGSVFVLLTLLGIYKQGPLHYFANMVPPGTPWPLWPLMFLIEFTGPIIKCGVLCVRLFANMIAGHLVVSNVLALAVIGKGASLPTGLGVMMILVGVPLSLGILGLEFLVCFIQAYVFTMLAIIFVGAAAHPAH